jgi:hypothetical protein
VSNLGVVSLNMMSHDGREFKRAFVWAQVQSVSMTLVDAGSAASPVPDRPEKHRSQVVFIRSSVRAPSEMRALPYCLQCENSIYSLAILVGYAV